MDAGVLSEVVAELQGDAFVFGLLLPGG